MSKVEFASEILKLAKSLVSAAGPYTLLQELKSNIHRLDDDKYLYNMSLGWGHTPGTDFIFGTAGTDISSAMVGYNVGNYAKDKVIDIVRRNIDRALKDNKPFEGLRGEQPETHKLWFKMMREWKRKGYRNSSKQPWDSATERHFQQWLDRTVHDDERDEVEEAIKALVEDDPSLMEGAGHSWPELRSMARKGRMASLRKADSGDVTAYFNISDFMVPKEGGRMSPDMQDDAISFLQDAVEKSMSELSRIVKSNLKKSKDIDDAGLKLK